MQLLNHWLLQLQTLQVNRAHDVESNASCDLDLWPRTNQIFLVYAFPDNKQLQTLQVHRSYDVEDTGRFMFVLDLRSRME